MTIGIWNPKPDYDVKSDDTETYRYNFYADFLRDRRDIFFNGVSLHDLLLNKLQSEKGEKENLTALIQLATVSPQSSALPDYQKVYNAINGIVKEQLHLNDAQLNSFMKTFHQAGRGWLEWTTIQTPLLEGGYVTSQDDLVHSVYFRSTTNTEFCLDYSIQLKKACKQEKSALLEVKGSNDRPFIIAHSKQTFGVNDSGITSMQAAQGIIDCSFVDISNRLIPQENALNPEFSELFLLLTTYRDTLLNSRFGKSSKNKDVIDKLNVINELLSYIGKDENNQSFINYYSENRSKLEQHLDIESDGFLDWIIKFIDALVIRWRQYKLNSEVESCRFFKNKCTIPSDESINPGPSSINTKS